MSRGNAQQSTDVRCMQVLQARAQRAGDPAIAAAAAELLAAARTAPAKAQPATSARPVQSPHASKQAALPAARTEQPHARSLGPRTASKRGECCQPQTIEGGAAHAARVSSEVDQRYEQCVAADHSSAAVHPLRFPPASRERWSGDANDGTAQATASCDVLPRAGGDRGEAVVRAAGWGVPAAPVSAPAPCSARAGAASEAARLVTQLQVRAGVCGLLPARISGILGESLCCARASCGWLRTGSCLGTVQLLVSDVCVYRLVR